MRRSVIIVLFLPYALGADSASRAAYEPVLPDMSQPADEVRWPGVRWHTGRRSPGSARSVERVVRKLKAGEMPPVGAPRPDEASLRALAAALSDELDAAARRSPYAGRPVVRRLNRNEYSNAIRDLLGIELPVASELPQGWNRRWI